MPPGGRQGLDDARAWPCPPRATTGPPCSSAARTSTASRPRASRASMGDCQLFFGLLRLAPDGAAQRIWCAFTHSNHAHAQTQTQDSQIVFCWQVAQLRVLLRAHGHGLRHAPDGLLAAREKRLHATRSTSRSPSTASAACPTQSHAGQQRVAVVARLEPHLLRPQLGPLPVRQWNAGAQPLRAHTCNPLNALARTHAPLHAQINFASLICAFFGTSAVFHFWAIVVGAYER